MTGVFYFMFTNGLKTRDSWVTIIPTSEFKPLRNVKKGKKNIRHE